jgi:hypothetical protein
MIPALDIPKLSFIFGEFGHFSRNRPVLFQEEEGDPKNCRSSFVEFVEGIMVLKSIDQRDRKREAIGAACSIKDGKHFVTKLDVT